MTKEDFFKKLDQLLALKPFTPEGVGSLLSLNMKKRGDEGNEFFDVYSGDGSEKGGIREAELRVPTRSAATKDGILILRPGPDLRIMLEEVMECFGRDPLPVAPDPRAPRSAPVYYAYKRGGSKLSFGFGRDEDTRLISVVIDRTESGE